MANNNDGQIVLGLDILKTVSQINADIKKLEKQLEQVKSTGTLDTDKTVKQLNAQIKALQSQLKTIEIKATVDPKTIQKTSQQIGNQIKNATKGSSVASEILNASDLDKQGKTYILKVSNTIEATKKEIQSKLRNSGYFDIEIKGVEKANGQIKSVTVNATNAKGVLEQLNFERAKMQKGGKVTNALVQKEDVKILGTLSSSVEKVLGNLTTLKNKWEEQGVLVSDFKTKVEQLEASLTSVGSKGELNGLKSQIETLKSEASQIAEVNKIQLSTDITKIENDYKRFGIVSQEVENNLKELKIARENALKAEGTDKASVEIENYNRKLAETKSSWKELQATQVSVNQRTSQMTEMQEWMRKNKNATKLCGDQVQKLIQECQTCDKVRFDQIKNEFRELQVEAGKAGKLGNTLFGGIIEQGKKFIQWTGVTGAIMTVSNKVREAVDELKDLDDILTEITKTSDLTEQQLKKLGDSAYDTASKYGRTASDYLTGVQEMYRSGFSNAEEMAELSILAQSAGDMDKTLSNDYLLATNAAYKYKGSVEELNKVLDSQNYITNNAAVSMQDMADATSEAASIASQYGVEVDELSALIAVAVSKTRESGSEVGTALKALLINLQDTTSKPITEAFDAVGISMTKMVNGSEQLKTPIELIKELSVAFNSLPEGDIKRANILNDIGGKHHANTLAAILSDLESYNSMLELYNNTSADGSAFREAEKSANNLSGSLNKLSNTWTDTVDNILNSDTLTTGVNVLNDLLGLVNKLTESLGGLGTIGLAGGLFASFKGAGRVKIAYPHLYTYACRNKTLYA